MNTQSELERIVRAWLEERVAEPPQAGLENVLKNASTTPQRRRGWLDRLTGRGRGATRSAHDRDHRSGKDDARSDRMVVTATGLLASAAVLAVAAALVIPADRGGSRIIPGTGAATTHVVVKDGSGEFTTIGEALAAAVDGDTILVGPGEYVESLVIDKDITITGDGAPGAVVIGIPQDAPTIAFDEEDVPFGIRLALSDASISNLSLAGRAGTVSVLVEGGSPTLSDLRVDGADPAFFFAGGSTPTLTGSSWNGYLKVRDGAAAVIEDNTISAAIVSIDGPGETILRGNTFVAGASTSVSGDAKGTVEGNDLTGGNIAVDTGSDILVQHNTVRGYAGAQGAIAVTDLGSTATVSDNTVSGSVVGIFVESGAEATVERNALTSNRRGIFATTPDVVIEANTIRGSDTGMSVLGGTVAGNVIEGNETGLSTSRPAATIITGNTFCQNGVNVRAAGGEPISLDGNEVCPETASTDPSG